MSSREDRGSRGGVVTGGMDGDGDMGWLGVIVAELNSPRETSTRRRARGEQRSRGG